MNFQKKKKNFFLVLIGSFLNYLDKVRGATISNSSLFMLRSLFFVSMGSDRGWSVR